jgi:hypothetical protein
MMRSVVVSMAVPLGVFALRVCTPNYDQPF